MRWSYFRNRRMVGRRDPGFPVPFLVGATRSGTTLLRLMMDAHPELAIPYETHFITRVITRANDARITPESMTEAIAGHKRWPDFRLDREELLERLQTLRPLTAGDSIRTFFQLYAEGQGKPRWGDKTPRYVRQMRRIERVMPEIRFVHIIRDGRDVALSVLSRNFGPETIEEAAKLWRSRIRKARRQAPQLGHYMEIHFEDLIRDTEGSLRRICDFIELEFDPAMLNYYERAEERLMERNRKAAQGKPGKPKLKGHQLAMEPPRPDQLFKWRERMSDEDLAAYERVAGKLLAELGYETGTRTAGVAR
jgi:hypothetical protein